MSVFTLDYWKKASRELVTVRSLILAAILIALRVVLKSMGIQVGENLKINFGFFVSALGGMCYGPVVAALAAAVSDTLGCVFFPSGPYYFPFIFVEILGSVIFSLMLYRQRLTTVRVFLSRFLVILFCNILLNPLIMIPYMKLFYGKEYAFLTLPRVVKNVALFPLESVLLVLFLNALFPVLRSMKYCSAQQSSLRFTVKNVSLLVSLTLFAALCVFCYYRFFLH